MRILVISNLYPPEVRGGYEILCKQVCSELLGLGHEIHVLTTPTTRSEEVSHGVRRTLKLVAQFDEPPNFSRWLRWITHQRNFAATRRAIREFRPDIIFVWSQLRLTIGCALAAERSNVPVAYTMNDEHLAGYNSIAGDLKSRIRRFLDDSVLGLGASRLQLRSVTCISRTLKERLQGAGVRIPSAKVIFQGIPVDKFPLKARPGELHNPVRLLYVGQLHDYKGVHTLLEAGNLLSRAGREIEITVCGAGDRNYEKRLRDISSSSAHRVSFLGTIHHTEIPDVYRSHDVLVFPSIWKEPFGLTHLEAMASGTTVISTNQGGQGEFLVDRSNALIFASDQPNDLARKITCLLDDPGLSNRIARFARSQVASEFSVASYSLKLNSWLQTIEESHQKYPQSAAFVPISAHGSRRG